MTRIKFKAPVGLTIGKTILMGVLSLTLIFFCTVFGFLNFYSPSSNIVDDFDFPPMNLDPQTPNVEGFPIEDIIDSGNSDNTNSTNETTPAEDPNANTKDKFYNFLIIGRDATSGLTDVMMIVSFDTKSKEVSVLNVPRDSYVNQSLPHRANAMFATAYSATKASLSKNERINEAMKSVKAKIRQVFGIPVHYTIYVDLAGFRAIVDAVGGVEVNVPMRMSYSDPEQNLYIDLQPGYQTLNGAKAEQFVRYRKGYANQDLGRIEAQQQLISSLIKKCAKFDIPQIKRIIDAAYKNVITNMETQDILWFAQALMGVDPSNIRFNTMPGEGRMINGGAYYVLYKKEIMQMVNKYNNIYNDDLAPEKFNIYDAGTRYSSAVVNIDGTTMASMK